MAKGRKGKKGKGRRRYYGKKNKSGGRRGHQFGIAESLGLAGAALTIAANPSVVSSVKGTISHPTMAGAKMTGQALWAGAKLAAAPAVTGILISNANAIPFVGRLVARPKAKVDRVVKKYTGMKL